MGRLTPKQKRDLHRKKYLIAYREDTKERNKRFREIRDRTLAGVIASITARIKRSCKEAKKPIASCSEEELDRFLDTQGIIPLYAIWLDNKYDKNLKPIVFRINNNLGFVLGNLKLDTYAEYRKSFKE